MKNVYWLDLCVIFSTNEITITSSIVLQSLHLYPDSGNSCSSNGTLKCLKEKFPNSKSYGQKTIQ